MLSVQHDSYLIHVAYPKYLGIKGLIFVAVVVDLYTYMLLVTIVIIILSCLV